ncbi:MAG: alpha-glucosidase/alpha-galactosidase [Planctomycetes bacterium]|nr:alpha-glucosidase/alpha-galactosidase [Planctomycetota bacterium]
MAKITFLGAGSSVFAKNILGDCMLSPALHDAHIALYDINSERLSDSKLMLDTLNRNINQSRATITTHLGTKNRKAALKGADYVVNAIQVGGYKPSTVIDFDIPKKYGLRQTIADTLGIGGIFRTLRTLPVMWDFARDMEEVAPGAMFLNYTNPMCMLVMGMSHTAVRTVGLCHSVQACVPHLLAEWGTNHPSQKSENLRWKIAGINHQAWLLELFDGDKDIYPQVKKLALAKNDKARKPGGKKHWDMVRYEFMRHFGYYITESSEHSSEYMPYWIKARYPQLVKELNIPLDEYPRRCINQIASWKKQRDEIVKNPTLSHERSHEYGSYIIEAMETNNPIRIHGNIMNTGGLITNLPRNCSIEVACLVDRNGVQGTFVGALPEQLAAVNRTNINVQILTVEAARLKSREHIYHAAYLDPHTSAELTLDKIRDLCDDLIEAHGNIMPKYR